MKTPSAYLLAVAGLLSPYAALASDPPAKPHIIFILADDLGVGDVGCYGGAIAPTPNLDRMAADGIRFTQYYAAAPICSPSRCGLITGQFPARSKITSYLQTVAGNRGVEQADFLDTQAPSLPRALRDAGYKTAHVGKWHLGGGRDVENPPKFAAYGYDASVGTWESPEPHPNITGADWIWSDRDKIKRRDRTAFFVDKTLDFLQRHQESPCFVNLWLDDPHTPWVPDADASPKSNRKADLKEVLVEMDGQIGRLREGLKSLAVEEKTLLIFTSDNGPLPTFGGQRSGDFRGSKLSLYEGGMRVPFIACFPGVIPAKTVNTSTVLAGVDMLPTLGALAGATARDRIDLDGENLLPAILGAATAVRSKPLFWEYGRNEEYFGYPSRARDRSPNVAIRDGAWKLLVNADGSDVQLYNVITDEGETTNLAAEHPELVVRLKNAAIVWRQSVR